jgi:hypothetical protein
MYAHSLRLKTLMISEHRRQLRCGTSDIYYADLSFFPHLFTSSTFIFLIIDYEVH